MIMYHQSKFYSKRISNLENTVETVIFWSYEPLLTVTLKIANKSFCMTLQPMMMHHNTEFGSKMCGGLENIIWINIEILTLRCDLDLYCNNPIFPQDALAYHQTKFGCQRINSLEDVVIRVIFWSYEPWLWPWPWRQQTIFVLRDTLAHSAAPPYQVWWQNVLWFTKTKFTDIFNLRCDLDLECSNPIFPQGHSGLYVVLANRVWLQTDQQFRRYSRNSHILII